MKRNISRQTAPADSPGASAPKAQSQDVLSLIEKLKSKDDATRAAAWQSAEQYGAPVVQPLVGLMLAPETEVARAARRGLWRIVRLSGRPVDQAGRGSVVKALLAILPDTQPAIAGEILWMLSEIGGSETVDPIARFLGDARVREAAVAALQRIPGEEAAAALKAGLKACPEEFRPAIAQALRARGIKVAQYPSASRKPSKNTSVQAKS